MQDHQQQRLISTFRNVFGDPKLQVTRSTTANEVEDWDSLTHINLVVAIEREFKVKFTTAEVAGLQNVGNLMDLIERKTTQAK